MKRIKKDVRRHEAEAVSRQWQEKMKSAELTRSVERLIRTSGTSVKRENEDDDYNVCLFQSLPFPKDLIKDRRFHISLQNTTIILM